MALSSKWFGFGQDPDYDAGVRAMAQQDWQASAACFEKAMASAKTEVQQYMAESQYIRCLSKILEESIEAADFLRALELARQAVERRPNYPDFHVLLGRAYLASREYEAALTAFDVATDLSPHYVQAHLWRAACLQALHNPEWVIAIKRAQDLQPALVDSVRASLAFREKDGSPLISFSQAIMDAVRALPQGPTEDIEMGDAHASTGDFLRAVESYAHALELAPGYADVHCKLGQCLLELDDVANALVALDAALTINPRYGEALVQRGIALKRLGKDADARASFRKAAEVVPNHPAVVLELSRR